MPPAKASLRLFATAAVLFAFNGCVDLDSGANLTKIAEPGQK